VAWCFKRGEYDGRFEGSGLLWQTRCGTEIGECRTSGANVALMAVQAALGTGDKQGSHEPCIPYPTDSYTFISGSCCIVVSRSFPSSSPDRPTLCRLRFQDISLVSYWTRMLTPFFSVPFCLAKTSRRYRTSLLAKTATKLAKVRARLVLCFLRGAAYGWSRARLYASPKRTQRVWPTITVRNCYLSSAPQVSLVGA